MSKELRDLLRVVEGARIGLNRIDGKQLHSEKSREGLRSIVQEYFSNVRPAVVDAWQEDVEVQALDKSMQELLILCHKHGAVQRYRDLLKSIKSHLINLDARLVSSGMRLPTLHAADPIDARVISTLQALLPSAALSYQQAITDLQADERLSWRGPATDLREALRETLDHLAPDADVTSSQGFRLEPGTTGPTMKQKVRFILKSRGLSKARAGTTEDATEAVDGAIGSFVRSVYTRSSVSTHTPSDKTEVLRIRDLVRVVLCELLEIHSQRR